MVEFGAVYLTIKDINRIVNQAKSAERSGFTHSWFVDSHVLWMEIYPYMTLCALEAPTVKVGPMVTNPITRHPTVVASAMSALNAVTGGRAVMGIGRGDSSVRRMGLEPATLKEFEESLELICRLNNGEKVDYHGTDIQLEWAEQPHPIYVAAYGPKVLRLAGRMADGIILQIADLEVIRWSIERAREGAQEAGRNPDDLKVIAATASYIHDDLAAACEEVRWFPPIVSNHALDLMKRYPETALPKELIDEMEKRGDYDYKKHAKKGARHSEFASQQLIDRFTIVGSADRCREKIRRLIDLGVDQIALYLFDDNGEKVIEAYGKQIIPEFT